MDETTRFERRSFTVELRQDDGEKAGRFSGYATVFDVTDTFGTRFRRGCFKRSLKERGLPMLSWEHDWDNGPIGVITDAREDERGLLVEGELFIESDLPSRLHRAMLAGGVKEMSFGFRTREGAEVVEDEEHVFEIRDVDLFEVAVVVVGSNPETEILQVRREERKPIGSHSTATSDGAWDAAKHRARLPSPLPLAVARAAHAWLDLAKVEDSD